MLLTTSHEFLSFSIAYLSDVGVLLYFISFHVINLISLIQLSMSSDQLEENLSVLLKDVERQKPQRKSNNLITMVCICNRDLL